MGHPIVDLLAVGVAGAGAWYGYKRATGTVAAPPIAPALPNAPTPNLNGSASPAQAAAISQANMAVANGNQSLAQAALQAADALGLNPSSDLGQVAGGTVDSTTGDMSTSGSIDDTSTTDDTSALDDALSDL